MNRCDRCKRDDDKLYLSKVYIEYGPTGKHKYIWVCPFCLNDLKRKEDVESCYYCDTYMYTDQLYYYKYSHVHLCYRCDEESVECQRCGAPTLFKDLDRNAPYPTCKKCSSKQKEE